MATMIYDAPDPSRRRTWRRKALVVLAIGLAIAGTLLATRSAAQSPDAFRGQLLYEQACTDCHAESVHGRKQRKATSFEDIRHYVARWSKAAGKQWTDDEVHTVVVYLNERYYKYPCPMPLCKRESAALPVIPR